MKATRFLDSPTLEQGMRKLEHGHYFEKLVFMASPSQYGTLKRVLDNFVPLSH